VLGFGSAVSLSTTVDLVPSCAQRTIGRIADLTLR
jgi:hypothetical protein